METGTLYIFTFTLALHIHTKIDTAIQGLYFKQYPGMCGIRMSLS